MNKKINILFLVLVLSILAACGGSDKKEEGTDGDSDEKVLIRVGHASSEDVAVHKGSEKFAELIDEKSDGKMEVEIFANSALGGNREMLESLQSGTLEIALPSTAPLASFTDKMLLFNLPYLFENREGAEKVVDGPIGVQVLEDLEDSGFIGLGYMDQGFRDIIVNSDKPVRTPDDLKGKKIRLIDNPLHIAHFEELGATATTLEFSEVFSGLQQGVVDGADGSYSNVDGMGFDEVTDYLVETHHIYDAIPVLFSQTIFESYTEEQQDIIKEAAQEAIVFQRDLQAKESEEIKKEFQDGDLIEVIELTDEERKAFSDKAQPVYDKFEDQIGKDLIQEARDGQ